METGQQESALPQSSQIDLMDERKIVWKEVRCCPLCHSVLSSVTLMNPLPLERDRYGVRVRLVRCPECVGVFMAPRPHDLFSADWYRQGGFRQWIAWHEERAADPVKLYQQAFLYGAVLGARLWPAFRWAAGRPNVPLRVLDLGAANAGVVNGLEGAWRGQLWIEPRTAGFERDGADLREVLTGEPQDRIDLMLLCQTIDHLPDPLEVLQQCHARLLGGSGEAPHVGYLWVDFLLWDEQTVKIDHPVYFSKQATKAILRRAGFRFVAAAHEITPNHVGYLCQPV